ncbi:MAG: cardiolipin synthase [Lachnoclostridium sp.]|nr:cardiolipin synthase [Lachnospira sp.]MCM1247263.1 cardiolipin synthase [Lachnoclostridium sp.]MCM1536144.1 cardiolipin synthase [Clostridium sp.]
MGENYSFLWEAAKQAVDFVLQNLMLWNMLFAVIIVFFQRREPRSVWAWLLLLYFIPILGFVLYLFIGQDIRKRKMFRVKEVEDHLSDIIRQQESQMKVSGSEEADENIRDYRDLIMYNLEVSGAMLSDDNEVEIYVDGNQKFEALIADLKKAEHFIHLQYYIIRNDVLFQRIREVLEEKAAQGVEVRILFDAMGCRSVPHRFWKKLNEKGIQTAEFFPAIMGRLQMRINYRNHRKIVVIDNKTAYVGGFNIGKEYIDLDRKFGHWRDTHLRIRGSAVLGLQLRFLLDWNYAARENLLQRPQMFEGMVSGGKNACKMQIISSGPDNATQQVRDNYLRLISKAKKSIFIQTPYFIPDEAIFDALLIAAKSGIEVNIMFPCKPDHPFVYWATYSYIGDMLMAGAHCYRYDNGFLHSKGIAVDGQVFCYGTANMDIRSFALNFEVNAIVYDREKTMEMENVFKEDLKHCTQITRDVYMERKLWFRAREQVCRLLSPLL